MCGFGGRVSSETDNQAGQGTIGRALRLISSGIRRPTPPQVGGLMKSRIKTPARPRQKPAKVAFSNGAHLDDRAHDRTEN
jgi:hypothetical protein